MSIELKSYKTIYLERELDLTLNSWALLIPTCSELGSAMRAMGRDASTNVLQGNTSRHC